jgi:hypothetical protein
VLVDDIVGMAVHPRRRAPRLAGGRPLWLASTVVAGTGMVALAVSLAAIAVEPQSGGQRAAGVGTSLILPLLFAGFWLVDALIVDAVAQLMGRPTLRRRYLEVSAYTWPVLALFELVRLLQAFVDRAAGLAGSTAGNAAGFLDFALLAWFLVLVTVAVQAVYELPAASALAAALSPPAVVAMLLMAVLVVGTILHGAGLA